MKSKLLVLLLLFPVLLLAQGKRQLVWVIDAGHGGKDVGTKGRNITEKEINLKVAQEVVRLIRQHKPGIKVITTRNSDKFVSLAERCRIANSARADLFLSIHVNYARKRSLRGTETFYAGRARTSKGSANASKSELLARLLQNSYAASGRPTYRGVRTNRMYVTANTNMPAALTEIAFISNTSDAAYITTDKGMKETARMIFNGLMEYYTATQTKTHTKALNTLRRTRDHKSGVKNATRISVKATGGKAAATDFVESQPEEEKTPVVAEEKESKAVKEPQPEEQPDEQVASVALPVFSIQLFSCDRELKQTDKRLKGLTPVTFQKDGKMYKCLYAGTTDYQQVKTRLKTVRQKFRDAFIVAYLGEKSISTAEALKLVNKATPAKTTPKTAKKTTAKPATKTPSKTKVATKPKTTGAATSKSKTVTKSKTATKPKTATKSKTATKPKTATRTTSKAKTSAKPKTTSKNSKARVSSKSSTFRKSSTSSKSSTSRKTNTSKKTSTSSKSKTSGNSGKTKTNAQR